MTYKLNQVAFDPLGPAIDITAADLAGANSGQRNDLLLREQVTFRVVSTNQLYRSRGTHLALVNNTVSGTYTATRFDSDKMLNASATTVVTIPDDVTGEFEGSACIGLYQGSAGAVSFVAGAGVTFRGTPKSTSQYGATGMVRVGANEWAYL